VRWNNFHPRTFISASADWTVKIWDSKIVTPILSFDLAMAVVDAVWAPYSSTGIFFKNLFYLLLNLFKILIFKILKFASFLFKFLIIQRIQFCIFLIFFKCYKFF
jgi:hypothetical protein